METFKISRYKAKKNDICWALLVDWAVYISTTLILRGQPFLKIGSSPDMENHATVSLKGPKKQKIVFLGLFRLSEKYTCLRTPIVNQVLRSFWGVNQLSTTSGLRDMDFGQFWCFWAQYWPPKWVSPTFQSDHQISPLIRHSKDSKTTAVSEFGIIGRSPPSLDWSKCYANINLAETDIRFHKSWHFLNIITFFLTSKEKILLD